MASIRLGRNDPCWCGSGKKYKRCHLDRETQMRAHPHELMNRSKKQFAKPVCSHPEAGANCRGKIVWAHTVRRSADLKTVAADGHVMHISADFRTLERLSGKTAPRTIGINQASTFPGFCAEHDTKTFDPIENHPFMGSSEQCFLLMYRAWCREAHAKEAAGRAQDVLREADKGRSLADQVAIQTQVSAHIQGTDLGIRDLRRFKAILDTGLVTRTFDKVNSTVFEFSGTLPVVATGAWYPPFDLSGRRLQTLQEDAPQPLAITLLNDGGTGFGVLSWFVDASRVPLRFVESLRASDNVADALIRTALGTSENAFFSPEWWKSLTQPQQNEIVERLDRHLSPYTPYGPDDLKRLGPPAALLTIARTFGV